MNKVVFWKIIFLNSSINNESKLSTRGAEIIKKQREFITEQNVLQLYIRRANQKFNELKMCVDGYNIMLNSIDTATKEFTS